MARPIGTVEAPVFVYLGRKLHKVGVVTIPVTYLPAKITAARAALGLADQPLDPMGSE